MPETHGPGQIVMYYAGSTFLVSDSTRQTIESATLENARNGRHQIVEIDVSRDDAVGVARIVVGPGIAIAFSVANSKFW